VVSVLLNAVSKLLITRIRDVETLFAYRDCQASMGSGYIIKAVLDSLSQGGFDMFGRVEDV
jgi:hypothetical protein